MYTKIYQVNYKYTTKDGDVIVKTRNLKVDVKNKPKSPEDKDAVIKQYNRGKNAKEIAKELEFSYNFTRLTIKDYKQELRAME